MAINRYRPIVKNAALVIAWSFETIDIDYKCLIWHFLKKLKNHLTMYIYVLRKWGCRGHMIFEVTCSLLARLRASHLVWFYHHEHKEHKFSCHLQHKIFNHIYDIWISVGKFPEILSPVLAPKFGDFQGFRLPKSPKFVGSPSTNHPRILQRLCPQPQPQKGFLRINPQIPPKFKLFPFPKVYPKLLKALSPSLLRKMGFFRMGEIGVLMGKNLHFKSLNVKYYPITSTTCYCLCLRKLKTIAHFSSNQNWSDI